MNHSNPERNKQIGAMLQSARVKQNVTQKQVADYIGISMNQISCIETGRCKASIEVLLGYCEKLELTPSQILNYSEANCDSCFKIKTYQDKIDSIYKIVTA